MHPSRQNWIYLGLLLTTGINGAVAYAAISILGWQPLAFYISIGLSSLLLALAFVWQSYDIKKFEQSNRQVSGNLQQALQQLHEQRDVDHKELQMARKVHEGLLSLSPPQIPGIAIASRCLPAQSLGGDFFAFLDRRGDGFIKKSPQVGIVEYRGKEETVLGVIVGDVAGHGVSSALVMALSNGLMTEMSKNTKSPSHLLAQANERIHTYIRSSDIKYVTAFYGMLSVEAGLMRYAKAGHVCPFLQHADGSVVSLEVPGIFLGMYPGETYDEGEVQMAPGDRLVFFTDGITEVRSGSGEMYGEERLTEALVQCRSMGAALAVDHIFNAIAEYSERRPARDDQTLIIIDYAGGTHD